MRYAESSRAVALSKEEIMDEIASKCKDALKHYRKGKKFYRGVRFGKDKPYQYIEPSKHDRVSANTNNLYTVIIDNSDMWDGYPKRSKSVICSVYEGTANGYGRPMLVFPKDGYRIGVCPSFDMWDSFSKSGIHNGLGDFNIDFIDYAHGMLGRYVKKEEVETYNNVKKLCKEIDTAIEAGVNPKNSKMSNKLFLNTVHSATSSIFKYIKSYRGNMLESLESLLAPNKNGFKVVTSIGSLPDGDEEVWTDSDCYLVNADMAYNEGFML